MSGWIVVAISGVTNGGKGTLTKHLLDILPPSTRLICQDDYFFPEDYPHHVISPGGLDHFNWDIITSLNMDKMTRDVQEVLASKPTVMNETFFVNNDQIVPAKIKEGVNSGASGCSHTRPILLLDGFLLFDYPPLSSMCDLKYFFTLEKDECFLRRQTRNYDPPDPPGYFEVCVWPMYQKYLANVKENIENVKFLDGIVLPGEIFQKVYNDVLKAAHLPAHSNFVPCCLTKKNDNESSGLEK
ncbi:unnamed protein product [Meganyctiphanes norvegica]|uniref:Nicotinamide riboside kinase 1 n=1 Tax=Meganyctiphanes norvegica TaxID=48144 RepID=A0AAV2RQG7_MEGNR